jgi:transposase
MKPLSQDLRERIVAAYTAGEGSYAVIAARFKVGATVVGKLFRQQRELGTLQPQTHRRGRKPAISGEKETALREHLAKHPDATVLERRDALRLTCSEKTLWQTLRKLGWRFKKSPRGPRNKIAQMSRANEQTGSRAKSPSILNG